METFSEYRLPVENPLFHKQRAQALEKLDINAIDTPTKDIIRNFAQLPYCFTLQCCYGHFVHAMQKDKNNLEPLPASGIDSVIEYRIAYLALCIENGEQGKKLLEELQTLTSIDPGYVQFGIGQWFWDRQVNSYAVQVEPDRFKNKDFARVNLEEALHIEKVRDEFYSRLREIVGKRVKP